MCGKGTTVKSLDNLAQGPLHCLGEACCQTPIPRGLKKLNITLESLYNQSEASTCGYGFLAGINFTLGITPEGFPYSAVMLDWATGKMTCEEARSNGGEYICGENTKCLNSTNGPGYLCSCKEGFQGNPYTKSGCIAIGAFVFVATLILSLLWWYKRKIQEMNHKRNGGLLLGQLSVRSFKESQLVKATNNFDSQLLLGEGGNGWVYRGSADNIEIAVKKSKVVDHNQIEQFLNEADIVSKINHKNVVKLLGVCLDSKVPMLVYEFVPNGTLYQHLHGTKSRILDSWRICLRVAAETARALDYMHSQAYPPIIHRDVKSSNILLDGAYTAKVADFGASKLIRLDRTMAHTQGQGTMGYLDPEYLQTGELTTMSDVYGFGVVLMELLSKQKPITRGPSGEMIGLVKVFTSAVENNRFDQAVRVTDVTEHETEQVHLVANLAIRCVAMPSKKRPTMIEVADVLNGLCKVYNSFPVEGSCDEVVGMLDDQDVMTTSVHFELEYSGNV
ncbi:hypothetical protein ACHQM5_001419 [Ranunculus cassubicifolius]